MKLIIQIPAWNEEEQLPETLAALPSSVEGIDEIEVLVIDDGSTDRTAELAHEGGAEVIRMPVHRGLAVAFSTALHAALERGADVTLKSKEGKTALEYTPSWEKPKGKMAQVFEEALAGREAVESRKEATGVTE